MSNDLLSIDNNHNTYYYVNMKELEIISKWIDHANRNKKNKFLGYFMNAEDLILGVLHSDKVFNKTIKFLEENLNESEEKQLVLKKIKDVRSEIQKI